MARTDGTRAAAPLVASVRPSEGSARRPAGREIGPARSSGPRARDPRASSTGPRPSSTPIPPEPGIGGRSRGAGAGLPDGLRARRLVLAAWALLLPPLAACDLSAGVDDDGRPAVAAFALEGAEPPGALVDGAWRVFPGSRLTFSLEAEGPVERLILSANDHLLAELPAGATVYVDDCEAGPCGTGEPGEVAYTLAAVGSGDEPEVAARSLVVVVVEPEG